MSVRIVDQKVSAASKRMVLLLDNDGVLNHLFVTGNEFRKTYYDPRASKFIADKTHTPLEELPTLRKEIFSRFKSDSTLVAVYRYLQQRGETVNFEELKADFMDNVYRQIVDFIPQHVQKDERLLAQLSAIANRKAVFSNTPEMAILPILEKQGIDKQFEAVYGLESLGDVAKPSEPAYVKMEAAMRVDPDAIAYFDDAEKNLEVPQQRGWTPGFIGSRPTRYTYSYPDIYEALAQFPLIQRKA